ncbi:MAG: ABC transporter ATP-binding protein [Clostridia bacterium]
MLKIKDVYKSYKNKEVLKGVTLNIKRGEVKGLIGVNGAGKSTLIECVCGIKNLDKGQILIDNINIFDKKNRNKIKHVIGYMPQGFSMFNDLTVEENLKYLCAIYGVDENTSVENAIQVCYLQDYRNVLAKNLSGGYRQLLSMASAIIYNPKLLILDEPTASMDPLFRRKFWNIVKDCRKNNTTVLVITHYMEELVECDGFICLAGGKVSFEGSVSDFKKEGLLDMESLLNKYSFDQVEVK